MVKLSITETTKFINLCPHEINLIGNGGSIISFAESGQVARIDTKRSNQQIKVIVAPGVSLDIQVQDLMQSEVINLPEPQENVVYLVSSYVAQFCRSSRTDLLSPATDNTASRDTEGRVTGVRYFHSYL